MCTFEFRKIIPGRTVQVTLKMYSRARFSINHIASGERCVWCTGEKDELIRDYFWLASFPDLLSDPESRPMPEVEFMNEQFGEGFCTDSLNHREGGMVSLRFPSFLLDSVQ